MSVSPALSQIAAVESDLRALSLESRKKYVEVKSAAERAILRLRPLQETKIEAECLDALRSNLIIQPFLLACATKHPPLIIMSLNAMQRLSSCGALSAGSVAMLIGTLRILSECTQADILLRILQTLSLLANPATFQAGEETIPQALGICFRLHASELPIIYNTAAAALQQVISLVFERAMSTGSAVQDAAAPLSVTQITALRLLLDLILLAAGDPPQWLTAVHGDIPRPILLEMINSITKDYSQFILSHQLFIDVIRNQLRPFIIRLLNTATNEFRLSVRLIQAVVNMVTCYSSVLVAECESLMSLMIRMLEPEFLLWQRVLVLEAIKIFTEIPSLLVAFHNNFDCGQRNTKIFASMAHALGRAANQITLEDDKKSTSVTLWKFHSEKSKNLDLLSENSAPDYDELYSVSLATESLINIVNGIEQLSEDSDEQIRTVLSMMIMATWYPILAAFMMLLDHAHQDEQVQYYLLGFQSFSFSCGKLDREAPLSEFVKSLCVLTLPPGFRNLNDRVFDINPSNDALQWSISSKNCQAMKCLFNICHSCITKLSSSWIIIFTSLEKLDLVLYPNGKGQGNHSEYDVLGQALNGFFESTASFDQKTLMPILSTLGSLTLSSLANGATTENSNPDPMRMFPLVNFVKTLHANTFRIGFLWDFAIDHLSAVLHCKHAPVRAYGIQCVVRLVKSALKQLLEKPAIPAKKQEGFGSSPSMFLKTLRPVLKGRFTENGSAVLLALYDILQTCGQNLDDGWPVVISLLDDVITVDVLDYIPLAFKIVQLIVDDFLEGLRSDCYPSLVHTIGIYGRQRLVANISFTSIGLLWQVSDHLIRMRSNQIQSEVFLDKSADQLHLILFSELSGLSMDYRAELRNSAVQILHSTVAACGSYLSLASWQFCLQQILFKLYALLFEPDPQKRNLPSEVESSSQLGTEQSTGMPLMMMTHHDRDTAEKQWDETRVHALQGSARIFRQFFKFHEGIYGPEAWAAYLKFIENGICMESSEVAHYAIESVRDILQSPSTISVLLNHRELTDQVLILFKNVVNKAMERHHDVPFDIYTELLDCVSALIGESRSHLFSAQDLLLFLQLADHLSSLAPTQAREPLIQGRRETSLQRAALLLIDRLIVVESPGHLYAAVLLQIIKYVAGAVSPAETSGIDRDSAHAFAKRSMPVLATLYCKRCPVEVQSRVDLIVPLVDSLRQIMTSSNISLEMIRTAVGAFHEIIPTAVKAVHCSDNDPDLLQEFWKAIQTAFCSFLSELPSRSGRKMEIGENDHLAEFESMQIEVMNLLYNHVLPSASDLNAETQDQFLSLFVQDYDAFSVMGFKSWSASQEPPGKIRLMQSGLNNLFDSIPHLPEKIAKRAVLILKSACLQKLQQFIHDDHRTGARPLPRFRIEEIRLILTRLAVLEIPDQVMVSADVSGERIGRTGSRGVLLALFPTLARCPRIRPPSLQAALSAAFLAVSHELNLSL